MIQNQKNLRLCKYAKGFNYIILHSPGTFIGFPSKDGKVFPVHVIWSNYSDTTRPHPKSYLRKGNPLISGKSRLVKYYSIWPDVIPQLPACAGCAFETTRPLQEKQPSPPQVGLGHMVSLWKTPSQSNEKIAPILVR